MRVIKIGGNELADAAFLAQLAAAVAGLRARAETIVVVHGGGAAIADLQTQLNLPVKKVDGIRVTDAASLRVTEMVLSGWANKVLVRALLAAGTAAVGVSGVDGGLLRCLKKEHPTVDYGHVGRIDGVDVTLIAALHGAGFTPVVAPISLGHDGAAYNVNADEAASALAAALAAGSLDFVSNVPGVLRDGVVIPRLTAASTAQLIADGVITGGMIPKVRSALAALDAGVAQARIVNLAGLTAGAGTIFEA